MTQLKDVIKIDDWKKEKHVPIISLDRKKLNKGEFFGIEVSHIILQMQLLMHMVSQ